MRILIKDSLSFLALVIVTLLSICLGSTTLNPLDAIMNLIKGDETLRFIILDVRLPRVIGCIVVGIALAVSGLILQTIFRNPLVDPYTLGIANGALFFVGLGVLLGFKLFNVFPTMPLYITYSTIGSIITLMLIVMLAPVLTTIQLLIVGITLSFIFSAATHILIAFAELEKVAYFHLAILGTFSGITWDKLMFTIPIISICLVVVVLQAKWLSTLIMGEEYAMTMGTNVKVMRFLAILCVGILVAISVTLAGVVGFIGLATPHIARLMYRTSRFDFLYLRVVILGALLTVVSDTIARLILLPRELPITSITSLFGAPLLTYLILRSRRDYAV